MTLTFFVSLISFVFRPIIPSRDIIERNIARQRDRVQTIEKRSDILNPADWLMNYFAGSPTASGVNVNTSTALGVPAVSACVSLLADMMATLTPRLMRPAANGDEEVKNHPAVYALARPGDLHTGFELRQLMQTGVGFGGNGYARVHRASNGDPAELEWISPNDVTVMRNVGQRFITYQLAGMHTPTVILDRYDLVHIRGLSCDGIKGVSPIAQLRESIGISISQRESAGAMMSNGAKFSGFIEMQPSATEKQMQEVRAAWKAHQEGALNAGRTPVLWGAQFKSVAGMSAVDAQFLESRSFELREICRLYRIPSFLIGDTDKATSFGTGIEEQNLAFRAYSLTPWLVNWEQSLGYTLLTTEEQRAGYRFEFDREELHTFTLAAQASFISQMRTANVFSPNDARQWLGYQTKEVVGMDNNFAALNSNSSGSGAPQQLANPKLQPQNA